MNLADLPTTDSAYITRVKGRGAFRKRIIEMGFVKGQKVTSIKNAPLKDPIEYEVMGYKVSLRRSEAQLIEIFTKKEAKEINTNQFNGVVSDITSSPSNFNMSGLLLFLTPSPINGSAFPVSIVSAVTTL